jgi:hypothetical protein
MCNLVDAFMEEQYQDQEFLDWLEQKNRQIREQMEEHYSIEYAKDAIAAKMYEDLMDLEVHDMEKKYDNLSQWELLNEL